MVMTHVHHMNAALLSELCKIRNFIDIKVPDYARITEVEVTRRGVAPHLTGQRVTA
jgi:hypothetical protein